MIISNLAVLLAQRGLRTSKVSADTGISRTTPDRAGPEPECRHPAGNAKFPMPLSPGDARANLLYAPVELPGEVRTADSEANSAWNSSCSSMTGGGYVTCCLLGKSTVRPEHTRQHHPHRHRLRRGRLGRGSGIQSLNSCLFRPGGALDDLVSDAALEHLKQTRSGCPIPMARILGGRFGDRVARSPALLVG